MKNLGRVSVGLRWDRYSHEMVPKMRTKIECDCKQVLVLDNVTNQCGCGQRYNMSGQKLKADCIWL